MSSPSTNLRQRLGSCFLLAIVCCGSSTRASDASPSLIRNGFLLKNCRDCHAGEKPEGGLNLEKLSVDLADPNHLATWIDIHDRVSAGEMPPKEYQALSEAEVAPFLEATGRWLSEAQLRERSQQGRVPPRRLTNLQLERTLQSLLGIDIPLAERMPAEPRTGEYSTLAEKQSLSHYQMAEHLNIVDVALDEAFRRALTPDDQWSKDLTAEQISRTRTRTREPEFIDGEAVVWSGRLSFYGRIPAITAKEDGWYRVTFAARALKTIDPDGVWCTVRSGKCVSSAAQLNWVGAFAAMVEPREFTFEAWLPAGHMLEIRPGDPRLKQARFAGGQAADGEGGGQDVPGLAIAAMKVERFHRNADDAQIRHLLFGDLPISPQQPADQSRVEVRDPQLDGEYLLQRFATRAFRRPVEAAQLHRFVEIFSDTLNSQNSFVAALRAGYRAILCSARFMYFYEPPGELDDYSIASRLSYLLWNSLPDEQLLQLAAEGKLREPRVIAAQVDRMLASSQGQNFVRDFASEWLELRDIGFTEPDPKLYPEFDMIVQASMLAETQAFLQHMLEADRPVHELIASQTTFLNNRLADFYGIAGVHGDGLQRVELPSDSVRGGLLSQGAILKVTANGTHTSPVLRGVWISERLLGCPIPPPPEGVPAIEPDIRGATTIREQLDKHRQDSACATCHTKIDPPGFALENFDAAGGWRDVYPRAPKGQGHPASPVDASYVFADGRPFANFQEFRKLSARDPLPLARNFATHVLTYGTGGKPEFADRPAVEQIVTQTAEQAYGLRSILKAVTSSRLFLDN